MVAELQGAGSVGVRELARRLGRDVKRVHDDASAWVEMGLVQTAVRYDAGIIEAFKVSTPI